MPDLPSSCQVVIAGGGVMGASTAYHLARRGVMDIVLLEKQDLWGMGATGKCAGGVRYQFSTEINVRLSQLSLPMLDRFEDEMGQAIDRRRDGYLFLLTDESDLLAFKRNVASQQRLGVATEWLDGEEIRRRLPMLAADDVLAGTFNPQDGLADPNGVVMGYVNAAKRLGVQTFTNCAVTAINVERGKIGGVQTTRGPISCPIFINAAGPWAGLVSEMAGVPLPITPLRRQMLTTTPLPALPPDFPFVIDFTTGLYFHREGEGLLTGQSNPKQAPGFDEDVDLDWEIEHMEAAIKRLPLLAQAGRVAHWAGLYEVTPDAHPIIGAIPQIEGYYVIGGFSGHGFMHGPAAGLLMSEIVADGSASTLDISMLDYARFGEGRLIQEYNVI